MDSFLIYFVYPGCIVLLSLVASHFYNKIYAEKMQRENERKIKRLQELIGPLYFAVIEENLSLNYAMNRNQDLEMFFVRKPITLVRKIRGILRSHLYLADNEFHDVCLNFLQWASKQPETKPTNINDLDIAPINDFFEAVYAYYKLCRNEVMSIKLNDSVWDRILRSVKLQLKKLKNAKSG